MLEMGFQEDVQRVFEYITKGVANTPSSFQNTSDYSSPSRSPSSHSSASTEEVRDRKKVQVVLFSATLPGWIYSVANKVRDHKSVRSKRDGGTTDFNKKSIQ